MAGGRILIRRAYKLKAEYNQPLEMKPVKKSGKRPGYASLPARSLGESPHCFSIRILPRLRAGSDAYPGLRHTAPIANGFYLHSLHLSRSRRRKFHNDSCHNWSVNRLLNPAVILRRDDKSGEFLFIPESEGGDGDGLTLLLFAGLGGAGYFVYKNFRKGDRYETHYHCHPSLICLCERASLRGL
jgi:hypothetical protein